MGEAKRKGSHGGGHTGATAALEFFRRYLASQDGADITLRDAVLMDGSVVVACQIDGFTAALPTSAVRVLADVAESAMRKHPNEPESACLPDFIMTLRASADRVEQVYGVEACRARSGVTERGGEGRE